MLEISGLYKIIPLSLLRKTEGVIFDIIPGELVTNISSVDRVYHKNNAVSPGSIQGIERPWYMHTHQTDNLIVLHGTRHVELYNTSHGKVESLIITPETISKNGSVLFEGGAIVAWPECVFHRVRSEAAGSMSLNFAVHSEGFDIKTNFNIYDLNTVSGEYKIIREGFKDQLPQ